MFSNHSCFHQSGGLDKEKNVYPDDGRGGDGLLLGCTCVSGTFLHRPANRPTFLINRTGMTVEKKKNKWTR